MKFSSIIHGKFIHFLAIYFKSVFFYVIENFFTIKTVYINDNIARIGYLKEGSGQVFQRRIHGSMNGKWGIPSKRRPIADCLTISLVLTKPTISGGGPAAVPPMR